MHAYSPSLTGEDDSNQPEPFADEGEAGLVDGIDPHSAASLVPHQTRVLEHPQVPRRRWRPENI